MIRTWHRSCATDLPISGDASVKLDPRTRNRARVDRTPTQERTDSLPKLNEPVARPDYNRKGKR
jgi:hypothetical protein